MQSHLASTVSGIAGLLLLLLLAPQVSSRCDYNWLLLKDSCYSYFNQSEFWYNSEMACKEAGGHLVSVRSDEENRLVSKLSLCRDVWLGRYARDLTKLTDPSGYAWTDDEKGESSFSRHDFTAQESSIHRPLIYSRQLSWYNSLYHERHPYVCKTAAKAKSEDNADDCPSSMKFFKGNCYFLSSFQSNFLEADYFCRNRSTQMVSVQSEQELRFINTLDLSADSCDSVPLWLGLVKLNPCHPDKHGRELCYQWTDFSGKYTDFPPWSNSKDQGRPASDERGEGEKTGPDQNCVTLSGDSLVGANCNEERQFVCKAPAKSLSGEVWQKLDQPITDEGNSTTPELDVTSKPNVTANPETEPIEVKEPGTRQENKESTTGETNEPAREATPAPTVEATPAPVGEATPAPAGEATPAPAGETTPAPTGEATPAPAGEATPAPAGEATPAPAGEATPAPAGEATPAPTGEATPAPVVEGSKPTPASGEEPTAKAQESKEEAMTKEENAEAKKSPDEKPSEPTSAPPEEPKPSAETPAHAGPKEEAKPREQETNRVEERKPPGASARDTYQPYSGNFNQFFDRLRDALKPQMDAWKQAQGNRAKRSVDIQNVGGGSSAANPSAEAANLSSEGANPSVDKGSEATEPKPRRRHRRSSPSPKTPHHAPKQSAMDKETEYDYLVS